MATETQLVTGTDFVTMMAPSFDQTVAFYGDTLGLARSTYVPERGWAEFETGNLTLGVVDPERMGLEHAVNRSPVALHVEDVEQARAALIEKGVEFRGDTFDTGVCHMAFFSDPDGNALMLHHRYAPRVTEA
jgi:predicted enzyme related to lactoylglutathione lyase